MTGKPSLDIETAHTFTFHTDHRFMFNRRELLIGSTLTLVTASSKSNAVQVAQLATDDLSYFVVSETAKPLEPEVLRELRWGRAGLVSVFSPDGTRVLTHRRTDDFATIWDAETGAECEILHPFKITPEEVVSFDGTKWQTELDESALLSAHTP